MNTTLIPPDSLRIDAVVPQCLDNQYITDDLYLRMVRKRADYDDREIASLRYRAFRSEFIRSLIYSSQVVIQRAYFRNSEFLYHNYLSSEGEGLAAFANLVRSGVIVPFLFEEQSLLDHLEFDVRRQGNDATRRLLAEVGDPVTCVRLAVDRTENHRLTSNLRTEFGSRLTRPEFMPQEQRNAMAAELFTDRDRLQREGAWYAFNESLDSLVDFVRRRSRELLRSEGRPITRHDIYRHLLALDGSEDGVALGRFRPPDRDNWFRFELKKYVDLIYNTNLPDHLGRFTFTPAGLPTRSAVQDFQSTGFGHEQIAAVLADNARNSARRLFMARGQEPMSLPLLSELSISDVLEVRALEEWELFKRAQERILLDPLRCLEHLSHFENAFAQFQRALSNWYNRNYERRATLARYTTFVSLTLNIAGRLIVAGSDLGVAEKAALLAASDNVPRRVKGYAAKLLIGVYDVGKRRLDADRTYSIELMNSNTELMREDLVELLQSVERPHAADLSQDLPQLADRGAK